MGRTKNQTKGMALMVGASLVVTCMAPREAAASTMILAQTAQLPVCGQAWMREAEESCDGETQLWISAPEAGKTDVATPLEGKEAATSEQLRQDMRVPARRGRALPLTADMQTKASGLRAMVFGAALALGAGLRVRGGERR